MDEVSDGYEVEEGGVVIAEVGWSSCVSSSFLFRAVSRGRGKKMSSNN